MRKLLELAMLCSVICVANSALAATPLNDQIKRMDNVSTSRVGTFDDGSQAVWIIWESGLDDVQLNASISRVCDAGNVRWLFWEDAQWLLNGKADGKVNAVDCNGNLSVHYEVFGSIDSWMTVAKVVWIEREKWETAAEGLCLFGGIDAVENMTSIWNRHDVDRVSVDAWDVHLCGR